jgi:fructokinase|tara:strand:+ start:531 stop:1436 length:906 start_codon:yes stop_codon:yes gene_type:complete
MQIGIDLGATKIEYVLLDNNNKELERNRSETPKNFADTIKSICEIIKNLEKKYKSNFVVGICHPGNLDSSSGVIKNAHNSQWLNNKSIIGELKKKIKNDIFSENDANCFSLSEAIDGAARHYNSVFGIILGSGCGGGLVINRKIVTGANGLGGEWSLNQMPIKENKSNIEYGEKFDFSNRIEGYLSGKSIEKNYYYLFNEKLTAKEIFSRYRKGNNNAFNFVSEYKRYLARCLVIIVSTIDPDAIVFGGGVSNEIDFLDEVKSITSKYLNEKNLKTVLLKPIYGDASGVRGAALLGRQNLT